MREYTILSPRKQSMYFHIFVKTVTISRQYNMRKIIFEKIKLLQLLPVVLLPFAEVHRSQSETTKQSHDTCLRALFIMLVYTLLTPTLHIAYCRSSSRLLVCYSSANGGKTT
ncbi:hypothetical protein GOODEAATRI_014891 [Goodea atripinnis]|uniref:Uncharacterized protein n=1 Tax=Goodea atripinnis TaxID=208336 RepID=A0ABV0NAS6_9TELE